MSNYTKNASVPLLSPGAMSFLKWKKVVLKDERAI